MLKALIGWGVILLVMGYILPYVTRIQIARILGWGFVIGTAIFSIWITSFESATYRMIAIATLQLLSMKLIVMVEAYRGKPALNIIQWLAFLLGWFGMRPQLFEVFPSKPLNGVIPFLIKASPVLL